MWFGRNLAIASLAFAWAIDPTSSAAADVSLHCRRDAAKGVPALPGRMPYRQANTTSYRLVDDPQYRLSDDSQYRLIGDPRCRRVEGAPFRPGEKRAFPFKARAGNYQLLIEATALAEGIQAELLHAVIAVESAYDPKARSPKGALGLMQLMPGTAAQYGITNPRDPAQNLAAGARHLRYLLGEFDNDMKLALAAYNAGEQAVRKYSNHVPPYPETQAYVRRVLAYYNQQLSSLILGAL